MPVDEDGMVTAALEAALRTGPKFIYVLPNFQNPTGVTLQLERRRQLVPWPIATACPSSRTIPTASCAI